MNSVRPHLDAQEFTRRAHEIFERDIRSKLRPTDDEKFVAIDVESGDFATDSDDFTATERLLGRKPQARIWLMRVGQPAAYRIGGHRDSSGNR